MTDSSSSEAELYARTHAILKDARLLEGFNDGVLRRIQVYDLDGGVIGKRQLAATGAQRGVASAFCQSLRGAT